MISNIRKRDGQAIENFDRSKIVNAILKAMNYVFINDIKCAEEIADKLSQLDKDVVEVEEIQNLVEIELMKSRYKNVAKEYILYRDKRNIARGRQTYETYMSIVNTIGKRHHKRKCKHECGDAGGNDDEICQRILQIVCDGHAAFRADKGFCEKQLYPYS